MPPCSEAHLRLQVNFDKLSTLRPVFDAKNGTVTAANASPISDGAAALVLVSGRKAKELGLQVVARIRSFADAAQRPEHFTTAPSLAIPKALARANIAIQDVDFFEINEAFAAVALANTKLLNLDPAKVNVLGGSYEIIAGHILSYMYLCRSGGARSSSGMFRSSHRSDADVGVVQERWPHRMCWHLQWWRRCLGHGHRNALDLSLQFGPISSKVLSNLSKPVRPSFAFFYDLIWAHCLLNKMGKKNLFSLDCIFLLPGDQ